MQGGLCNKVMNDYGEASISGNDCTGVGTAQEETGVLGEVLYSLQPGLD